MGWPKCCNENSRPEWDRVRFANTKLSVNAALKREEASKRTQAQHCVRTARITGACSGQSIDTRIETSVQARDIQKCKLFDNRGGTNILDRQCGHDKQGMDSRTDVTESPSGFAAMADIVERAHLVSTSMAR